MKRSLLARTPFKRHLPKGRDAWVLRRDAHLAANPTCALRVWTFGYVKQMESGCWGPLDAHHVQPRGAGGTRNDESPLVTLCRKHHQYVEEHREWSRSVGLLMRRAA